MLIRLPVPDPRLQDLVRAIERAIRQATNIGTVTTYSGEVLSDTYLLLVDATSGPVTVTLPAAADHSGRILNIKKIDASANVVTIDANGAETIDGAANETLSSQWESRKIISNGINWYLI